MELYIKGSEVVSCSDISRNFSKYRADIKEQNKEKLVIFKNNKPDMVLLSYEKFEEILDLLNRLEDEIIYKTIESRPSKDDDPIYTLDDVKNKLKQRKK